jgi:hypothetical protein
MRRREFISLLCGEQGLFLFQIEGSAGCPELGEPHAETQPQYSSASMIVITRLQKSFCTGDQKFSGP